MGNIGSGFKGMCGFPDGYFPPHAPLGFPNCANYKGSQSQRIADLKKRGYGNDAVIYWNKWYEDQATAARVDAVIRQRMAVVDSERAAEAAIQLQREQTIYDAGVNVNSGCSECTGTELSSMITLKEGYHRMPDGSLMKDSDMEKKPLDNNMKFVGIAAAGVIGLLLYSKGGLKSHG